MNDAGRASADGWPRAGLDPVRRLRVMAAALGVAMYAEDRVEAPFDAVWATVSDLPGELPHLVPTIREFTMSSDDPAQVFGWAEGPFGHRARFEVVLRSGWCLMQGELVVGGMAAVPEGDGTRLAVLGGLRRTPFVPAQRALRGLGRRRGLRMIERARRRTALRTAGGSAAGERSGDGAGGGAGGGVG